MPRDSRLVTISELVPLNSRVADIGTDHAYLPIHLIKEGVCRSVIATDINTKPLAVAQKNIEKSGVKNIELRLCDGLHNIKPDEVDTIIIAGMGGEVISGIINRCDWIKNSCYKLILQPMSRSEDLRKFLCENGFEILAEHGTEHAGRVYTVMEVVFNNFNEQVDNLFYYIGKLTENLGENELKYIKWRRKVLFEKSFKIKDISGKEIEYKQTLDVVNRIDRILLRNEEKCR